MTLATARRPTLLSIASAFPDQIVSQQELWDGTFSEWYEDTPHAEHAIMQTRVRHRHMVWDPRDALADGPRSLSERMTAFEHALLDVGGRSVAGALARVERAKIGSFALATCTGYVGPTSDYVLAQAHGLRSTIRRTHVGHMGCFAAFNALKIAMDSLAARPDEDALINCSEFSSVHCRKEESLEQAVVHGLFGDASASAVLAARPAGQGVQFLRSHTDHIFGTEDLMTWRMTEEGFLMTLSAYVPFVIAEHIEAYVTALLEPVGLGHGDVAHWIIHPGGPKILDVITETFSLGEDQTQASWSVLGRRGNCSSATVLLVLEEMLRTQDPTPGSHGVMLAFGPGLTIEGAVIEFGEDSHEAVA